MTKLTLNSTESQILVLINFYIVIFHFKFKGATKSNMQCVFPATRDILLVMLSKEILIFDIEFGQRVASITCPPNRKPFRQILGIHGAGYSAGGGIEGGIDEIYCLHEDGLLSVWLKTSEILNYKIISTSQLIPKPIR